MEISEEKLADVTLFKLQGRLDSNTSPGFEAKLFESIKDGAQKLVVNFENLDYISSAGMRVILKATKELKGSGGNIVLCSMKDYVREVFEIAGFDTFITIKATQEEAQEAL